jgi:hypothetical protein
VRIWNAGDFDTAESIANLGAYDVTAVARMRPACGEIVCLAFAGRWVGYMLGRSCAGVAGT